MMRHLTSLIAWRACVASAEALCSDGGSNIFDCASHSDADYSSESVDTPTSTTCNGATFGDCAAAQCCKPKALCSDSGGNVFDCASHSDVDYSPESVDSPTTTTFMHA